MPRLNNSPFPNMNQRQVMRTLLGGGWKQLDGRLPYPGQSISTMLDKGWIEQRDDGEKPMFRLQWRVLQPFVRASPQGREHLPSGSLSRAYSAPACKGPPMSGLWASLAFGKISADPRVDRGRTLVHDSQALSLQDRTLGRAADYMKLYSETTELGLGWRFAVVNGFCGSFSLIRFIVKRFDIDLTALLSPLLSYYEIAADLAVEGLFVWVPFQLPHWYKDGFMLSFFLALPYFKTSIRRLITPGVTKTSVDRFVVEPLLISWLAILGSVILLGFYTIVAIPRNIANARPGLRQEEINRAAEYIISMVVMLATACALLLLNRLSATL